MYVPDLKTDFAKNNHIFYDCVNIGCVACDTHVCHVDGNKHSSKRSFNLV